LAAGILIGPYGLSIIRHVLGTKAIAEFGVVFLLFNIGLEVGVFTSRLCGWNLTFIQI
jgi:Kef-type K+ transport system membrane component KefB